MHMTRPTDLGGTVVFRRLGLVLAVISVTTAVAGSSAAAKPEQHAAASTTKVSAPMTHYRIVKKGAPQPDGRTEITLSNGVSLLVPTEQAEQAAVSTDIGTMNEVPGDCGVSYIYIREKSNGSPIHVQTGFKLNRDAWAYQWVFQVRGPQNYNETEEKEGNLAARKNWNWEWGSSSNERHGHWQAWVWPGPASYAMTFSGICFAGNPVAVGDV
jgi:hypothetical protein